jgi:uncharacterized membrane protein
VQEDGRGLVVVYVPTNNLYLGEVIFIPEDRAVRLQMTVEQAIRLLVSGGIASPRELRRAPASQP